MAQILLYNDIKGANAQISRSPKGEEADIMNFEITSRPSGAKKEKWLELIKGAGLFAEGEELRTLLVYDGDEIIAAGSREGFVLKLIAVADSHRGEDITASILTELRRDAFADGYTHLFLYTKPQNRYTFESLFFYPVIETEDFLVMENKKDGLSDFLESLPPAPPSGRVGAIVMNANPFTLGHRALADRAASECDRVFLFVLSEDKSEFSPRDRLEMVRRGVADIENLTVLSTGPYLISSVTFPTYFIKDRDRARVAACELDVRMFCERSVNPISKCVLKMTRISLFILSPFNKRKSKNLEYSKLYSIIS